MATSFVDRAGYRHTTHSTVKAQVVRHQVWTTDADGWYIGGRSLTTYPAGHESVPDGAWVLCSDYSPTPVRILTEGAAHRILQAWNAAGTGFLWQEATLADLTNSSDYSA